MNFLIQLLANMPAILGIVNTVEMMFGNTKGESAKKLAVATSFATTMIPAIAEAVDQPGNRTKLEKAISGTVTILNQYSLWQQQQDAGSGA